eukprot:10495132-Ditylum_brightwellii.AAC.1
MSQSDTHIHYAAKRHAHSFCDYNSTFQCKSRSNTFSAASAHYFSSVEIDLITFYEVARAAIS